MNDERPYNPDDIEFLMSRALDGDLSVEESRRLTQALEGSESLRVEAGHYRALHNLVMQWASRVAPDCEEEFAPTVLERTTLSPVQSSEGDRASEDRLDALLSGLGKREPIVDWDRFSSEVSARVGPPRRSAITVGRVVRWTGGLAAAAAIGLAFMLSVPRGSPSPSEHLVVWGSTRTTMSDFEFETSATSLIHSGPTHTITPRVAQRNTPLESSDGEQTIIWEHVAEKASEPTRPARSRSGWAIIGAGGAPVRTFGALP